MQVTATTSEKIKPISTWKSQLDALRRWIRTYILMKGLALLLATAAIGFWMSLAIDYLGELPLGLRGLILIVFFPVTLWVVWRYSLSRLGIPLSDSSMALLLERRYPMLQERLLTVVELTGSQHPHEDCDPRLVAKIAGEIAPLFPLAGSASVFNLRPLIRTCLLALLCVFSVFIFWLAQPGVMQVWAERNLAMQNIPWPRATSIAVDGFLPNADGDRVEKVARGGRATVRVRADLDFEIPQRVELHFAADDGTLRTVPMTRLKAAVPGRDVEQEYEYVFTNLRASTPLTVIGHSQHLFSKSDRVEGLRVEAVESPDLVDIRLNYTYPDYLKKPQESGSVRLNPSIPQGTQVYAICRSNKPLAAAHYRKSFGDGEIAKEAITLDAQDRQLLEVDLGKIGEDTQIDFQLTDTDRIENVDPVRLVLRTLEDEVPKIRAELDGIGKSVTPLAIIPLRGSVQDDYGVAESWISYAVDGGPEAKHPLSLSAQGELGGAQQERFDIEPLQLQPGQRISLQVQAKDHCNLREEEAYGEGAKYTLKIVTESQLRAELETREKILRRRMETILAEGQRMEDSLKRMRSSLDEDQEHSGPESTSALGREDSIRMVRMESAVKAADRMRHETANVSLEFNRILIELRNNRVALLGELEERIGQRIVVPLDRIATEALPQLEQQLQLVRRQIATQSPFVSALSTSQNQLSDILRQMERVIENMLKLQRFNEVLADLRKIIDAQRQVSRQTMEQRRMLEKQLKEQLKKDLLD